MTPAHPWLRCLFIGYNIFFLVASGLVIVNSLAQLSPSLDDWRGGHDLKVQAIYHIIRYIAGFVTMVISILGIYGAHQMNRVVLTVYLVCTVTVGLLMLQAGVDAAIARPTLESLMEERWRSFLPLDQASGDIKNQVDALQTSLHCCGLFSHEDWKGNIPDSCLCNPEQEVEGKCQTVSYRVKLSAEPFWQKKSVFRQNCFPLFMASVITHANITLGVLFTLFVLALLGSVLSALMICKMYTSNKPNTPLSAPVMFIDQPPAYQQLYNLSE